MKLCVEWWSIITSWHINVHYVKNLRTYECEVKHNGDMGMGHLMGGHLSLNGWGSYGKIKLFHLEICSKNAGLHGGTHFSTGVFFCQY